MKRLIVIYICLVTAIGCYAQMEKLSPFVRQAVMQQKVGLRKAKAINPKQKNYLTAFVRTSDSSVLTSEGCRIYAQWDDIYIAAIPTGKITTLAKMPQIERIEAGESCSLTNDTTATITHARDVWGITTNTQHPTPITGKDVVVGVMDAGFDLTHPTFYSADMKTYRVKRLWDMLDTSAGGEAVKGKTKGNDTIYVGRQYIGTDSLLKKMHSLDGFIAFHGTHTTGTAAGSGNEGVSGFLPTGEGEGRGLYTGMAPDADICLVSNYVSDDSKLVDNKDKYKYTTATDMLGFKYIFDYAKSEGKPCVINFSEGRYDDLYQSGIYQEVLSKMVGPGRIICAAAGNNGQNGSYIHKQQGTDKAGAFLKASSSSALYVMRSTVPPEMKLTFYPDNDEKKEWSYDVSALQEYPDSLFEDSISIGDKLFYIYLQTYPSCFDENLYATDFFLIDKDGKNIDLDTMPVSLTVSGTDNDIEVIAQSGWFVTSERDETLCDFTYDHNIIFPGAAKDVICVGNTSCRPYYYNYEGKKQTNTDNRNGMISKYSSIGPANNGEIKPDVCAPGMNVISSNSSFYREKNPWANKFIDVREFTYNDRKYYWSVNSGSSMSTPVVTGIIALWLQVCPTLTPDQIKDVFAYTCTHYDESLEYPNNTYGYGQIDALAGLEYIEKTYTGIDEMSNVRCQMSDAVYDISGRRINKPQHGIYIVTENGKTRKLVK